MQMFHAADVGMTPAYGCSWRVTDGVVDLTMHLNKVRLEEVFADANERDQVIGKFMLTCAARADTGMEVMTRVLRRCIWTLKRSWQSWRCR